MLTAKHTPSSPPGLPSFTNAFAGGRSPLSLSIPYTRKIPSAKTKFRSPGQACFSTERASSSPISTEQFEQGPDPDPQDLEYVAQIKNVLERLKKNRDMMFNEVKLTIMIEDPRDVERRRLLGIDDENAPTRDELADVLVEVNEGKIPENRDALRMLAEEISQWPNVEVEISKKKTGKSLYEKFTNTGVNPKEAAKRLNIDWDSAAEIEDTGDDQMELPAVVGFGALYLVSALPVIIGVSVVLILFYNSLQ